MTIDEWLREKKRAAKNAGLDAELILCEVLRRENSQPDSLRLGDLRLEDLRSNDLRFDRTYLVAHGERVLTAKEEAAAEAMFKARIGEKKPLAYLLKRKEFYGREFYVDERALIPRPETETIIETVKEIAGKIKLENGREDGCGNGNGNGRALKILDVGTGSSCVATTLKLELPEAEVFATDISEDALAVARRNAKKLGAKIEFYRGDLLNATGVGEADNMSNAGSDEGANSATNINDMQYDIIVANLPYVDKNWKWTSPELKHEPKIALYAKENGLAEIKRLLRQINSHDIFVVLELDPSQKQAIAEYAKTLGFSIFCDKPYCLTVLS